VRYLLDTNACISYLNNPLSLVRGRLQNLLPIDVVLCSVVEAELYFGVMKSARVVENMEKLKIFLRQFESLPFDSIAASEFGSIRALLANLGAPIGPYDLEIAAIARANSLTLVTHNTREFQRVPGLLFVDWECEVISDEACD